MPHEPADFQFPLVGLNVGDSSVVADKVKIIRRDSLCSHKTFRGFTVVRKLEEVKHLWVLLLEDTAPRFVRDRRQWTTDCFVPHLPAYSLENRVGAWDGSQLKLGRRRKFLGNQDAVRFGLFVGVVFPFDVPKLWDK